jgi:hypothetical protein
MESGIEFLELLSVALWAGFKFIVGVGLAIGFGFGFAVSTATTFLGGMVGVVVYVFFGDAIRRGWRKLFPVKRRFTRGRRRMVRLKHAGFKLGIGKVHVRVGALWVIAFLTPIILSMPIGTFLSVSMGYPLQRIFLSMAMSLAFWSLLFFTLYEVSGIDVHALITRLF